jgi:MraZ protein
MARESAIGTIYAGTFHRTMDAKNRVTIPSEWLPEEPGFLYVLPTRSNAYLNVMPHAELSRQEEELREMLPAGRGRREMMRKVFGPARRVEPDKQGRILIPDELCKAVSLSANVTFVGLKNSFEIWDATKWSSAAPQDSDLSDDCLKALEALGL